MLRQYRTLVVGTTSDYIDLLRNKTSAKSILFVTAFSIRKKAIEDRPELDEELLCDLDVKKSEMVQAEMVIRRIHEHILIYNIKLKGIVCFDCESMVLAAHIAEAFCLTYPSVETVLACRDKSRTRELWHLNGVKTPRYARISSAEQAVDFFKHQNQSLPCVLKPLDSSGSERVFMCATSSECEAAYKIICSPQQTPDIIIETYVEGTEYSCDFIVDDNEVIIDTNQVMVDTDEVIVDTDEVIVDTDRVMVDTNQVIPIRFTKKIKAPIDVFGTIMAYEMVDFSSENCFPSVNFSQKNFFSKEMFRKEIIFMLSKAAKALGIRRGLCMADFIITNNCAHHNWNFKPDHNLDFKPDYNLDFKNGECNETMFLLEMTPRPGGDCLPWLIQNAINIDILKLTLDFADPTSWNLQKNSIKENLIKNNSIKEIPIKEDSVKETPIKEDSVKETPIKEDSVKEKFIFNRQTVLNPLIGLRIHAKQAGILQSIDTHKVKKDARVKQIFIKHKQGHRILLPPEDYDSWNLGHIIFKPYENISHKEQCLNILSQLKIEIAPLSITI